MHATRASLRLLVLAALTCALAGATTPAEAAFPGANGKIAFVGDGVTSLGINVIEPDGTGPTQLTSAFTDGAPSWSADGSKLAFNRSPGPSIVVMDANGQNKVEVTNNGFSPAWSPDGTKIAFVRSSETAGTHVWVMNADGSGQSQLGGLSTLRESTSPAWSPGGTMIAFVGFYCVSDGEGGCAGRYDIFVVNADGTSLRNLTNDGSFVMDPDWSPDGTQIAYSRAKDDSHRIHVVPVGSGGVGTAISPAGAIDDDPAWSPDGKKIVFQRPESSLPVISVMNADGSGRTDLAPGRGPSWQPLPGPVSPAVDLALTMTAKPKTAKTTQPLVYTITVKNLAAAAASGVVVTDDLDLAETFQAATPSQGSCSTASLPSGATRVSCELGILGGAASATVEVEVTPTTKKTTLQNTAYVAAINPDANVPNNSATVKTKVVK